MKVADKPNDPHTMPTLTSSLTNRESATPPIKWAGSKRWLANDPDFLDHWAKHHGRRLVELFCGSGALTLGLQPETALLVDINRHVVNFLRHLSKGLELDSIPVDPSEETFYANRKEFNRLIQEGRDRSRKGAELFYYLNRTCYNGLCRFNRKGEFNTPWGKYERPLVEGDLSRYRDLLNGVDFSTCSFERAPLDPQDFVYADPPYLQAFTEYSKHEFGWPSQVRLALFLDAHPGPVAASNHWVPELVALYRRLGFTVYKKHVARMINCNGNRTPAVEMLAIRQPKEPEDGIQT